MSLAAQRFEQVIATELAKVSVNAARHNIERNQIDNIEVIRLSAEETSQAMNAERSFRRLAHLPKPLTDYDLRTVFVDPPRAGLDEYTELKHIYECDAPKALDWFGC